MKTITYENIRNFAYVNDDLIVGAIRGVIIDFFGLGVQNVYDKPLQESVRFAEKGYLHIIPYNNPWAWMNDAAFDFTETIFSVMSEKYGLSDTPLVVCGASMGGLSALVFAYKSKKTPVACITNCPVCDLLYHYGEHSDMPRTIYSAFYKEGEDLFENMKKASPMHHVGDMPDIKYTLFQCADDDDVHPYAHSERFVPAMRAGGKTVDYIVVPDSGHCGLNEHYLEMYFSKIEEGFLYERA